MTGQVHRIVQYSDDLDDPMLTVTHPKHQEVAPLVTGSSNMQGEDVLANIGSRFDAGQLRTRMKFLDCGDQNIRAGDSLALSKSLGSPLNDLAEVALR